jgi:predicted metal-dependent hydrolase
LGFGLNRSPQNKMPKPPPELYKGIEEFNAGQFFECHETLEAIWIAETDEVRKLYQGILQIGVGFHHTLKRKNYRGATTLLQGGINYCTPFSPRYFGIEIAALIAAAEIALEYIKKLGPEHIADFDTKFLPIIKYDVENSIS